MEAFEPRAGLRRDHRRSRRRFLAAALALFTAAAIWATWPAVRHLDGGHYLARPAAGYGEAAAGDHLQLGWAFWMTGHQLERGDAPWRDPYTFQPVADAPANLQGWLLGLPFWPLERIAGPVWAYNLVLLVTFLLAGGLATWWLRTLGLGRAPALVGGLVFALAPYRVGQSTGHLLGLASFLLPGMLLALERRRWLLAAAALLAIPCSGQFHLALGAIPLAAGYALARHRRHEWWLAGVIAGAAVIAGWRLERWTVEGSVVDEGTRSFGQVERYSADVADFVTRSAGDGIERFVFVGWLTPLLALAGLLVARRLGVRMLAFLLAAAAVPVLLALGANLPGYRWLWEHFSPLAFTRVPERLLPIAALALAALVGLVVDAACRRRSRRVVGAIAAAAVVAVAVDLRVPVFGAVAADTPNRAYAALAASGTVLELPVIRPDLHFGSTAMAYARQSPRPRPQGYSTIAPPDADRFARRYRGLSCGRWAFPEDIDLRYVVVHEGLYRQTGFFGDGCAAAAEARLRGDGWKLLARDGALSAWERP